MAPHIDTYGLDWLGNSITRLDRIEGEHALELSAKYMKRGIPLPLFGDYVYITAVHEDDECGEQGIAEGPLIAYTETDSGSS